MDLSVVVPVFNELESIQPLYQRIRSTLETLGRSWEIVFVDDGSTDGSTMELARLVDRDPRVRLVQLRRNFGQTAALQAGLDHASGEVVVTMDGDLQNDPADIPALLVHIDKGYDLVHGWRRRRHDPWLSRTLPSRVANWLIARTTRFPIHDLGCTLKAMRREVAAELELYGEMHRFIPILAHQRGARCLEVETRHHPRAFGKTKYGLSRTFRVVLDLITVKYLLDYFASPMKLFGKFGIASMMASITLACVAVLMKLGGGDMTSNPYLLLSVVCAVVSVQFFSLGLLGEVNARIYYSRGNNRNYSVREHLGFDLPGPSALAQPLVQEEFTENRGVANVANLLAARRRAS